MKYAKYLILLALFAGLIGGGLAYASQKEPVKKVEVVQVAAPKKTVIVPPTPSELLRLTNIERAKVGVKPLVEDPLLDKSAQLKSEDENTNNYFGHVNPKTGKHGYTLVAEQTSKCVYASENLVNNIVINNAEYAMGAWMQSEPHRKAILDPRYEEIGFGISGKYITAHFCDLN